MPIHGPAWRANRHVREGMPLHAVGIWRGSHRVTAAAALNNNATAQNASEQDATDQHATDYSLAPPRAASALQALAVEAVSVFLASRSITSALWLVSSALMSS